MKTIKLLFLLAVFSFGLSFDGTGGSGTLSAQIISTIAGTGDGGYSGDGGAATAAEISGAADVSLDGAGNIYIADVYNQRIREVNTFGIITTIAGNGIAGYSGDTGPATAAELDGPFRLVADKSGIVYITDYYNYRIRMVNTSGIITTIAGTGVYGYSGNGGQATNAELSSPHGIALDKSGNIIFADCLNNVVRLINPSGVISTIAGNGIQSYSGDGGQATAAELYSPVGISVDTLLNVYITDQGNERIRMVNFSGIISSIAGNGVESYSGDGGLATAAELSIPFGTGLDYLGNLYIADQGNNRVRIVNTSGTISTIAGNGSAGFFGDGGPASAAELHNPLGVITDNSGNLFIADYMNNVVRIVNNAFITGTATIINNSNVKNIAYPNPNNGIFTISCHTESAQADEESQNIIEVYNVFGEKIYSETLRSTQGDYLIDLAGQPAGVYLYRVMDENGKLIGSGKFVVEK